jgi:hypothetical protein
MLSIRQVHAMGRDSREASCPHGAGDLDNTFDWDKLKAETKVYGQEARNSGFTFTPSTQECAYPTTTPEDRYLSELTLCPTDWKNFYSIDRYVGTHPKYF